MANPPPLPEGKMNLLTEGHCFVDLMLDHPVFGEMQIDTVQRTIKECECVVQFGYVVYKSMSLKLIRHRLITQEEYPLLHGKAYYVFIVADPSKKEYHAPNYLPPTTSG